MILLLWIYFPSYIVQIIPLLESTIKYGNAKVFLCFATFKSLKDPISQLSNIAHTDVQLYMSFFHPWCLVICQYNIPISESFPWKLAIHLYRKFQTGINYINVIWSVMAHQFPSNGQYIPFNFQLAADQIFKATFLE